MNAKRKVSYIPIQGLQYDSSGVLVIRLKRVCPVHVYIGPDIQLAQPLLGREA